MAAKEVQVERIDEKTVRMQVTVPQEAVDEALASARKIVDGLKDRPLGKKQLGEDPEETAERAIANRATRMVVEAAVRDAVKAKGLRLSANPEIGLAETVLPGSDFTFAFEANVVPELQIEPFERLEVTIDSTGVVTEEDVDAKLEEIRVRSATVQKNSPEPIGSNDLVRLSFTSTIDGEAYEGGEADGMGYQMGSLMLPQAFEDGLVGLKAGEGRTIEFVVPADFENPDIAGKKACFDVQVSDVAKVVLPDLDDAFAREFDYRDLAHFRETLRGRVREEKAGEMEQHREKRAREVLAERLVGDVPEDLASAQALRMLEAFKLQMKQQGVEFAEYCGYLGITEADVLSEMREQAQVEVRENLALEALFRYAGLEMTEADVRKTADEIAYDSGLSPEALYVDMNQDQRSAIEEMTQHRMATEWLLDRCDFVMAS